MKGRHYLIIFIFCFILSQLTGCQKDNPVPKNHDKEISLFAFTSLSPTITGAITGSAVSVTVPIGTNVTFLIPTVTISSNATVSPASGLAQDFTNPVPYTVTAQDGSSQIYTVTVTLTKNTANDIISFNFAGLPIAVAGVINGSIIGATVPFRTNVTALVPTVIISDNATLSPASGTAQDFTNPVIYTVTAEDGSTQSYTVTVSGSSSWTAMNNDLKLNFFTSLVTNGNNLFVGENNPEAGSGSVYLTTDDGVTWTEVNNGLPNHGVVSMAVMGDDLFVGINGGLYVSANNGSTWINTNLTTTQSVIALAVNGNNLFAGTNGGGVALTSDNGATWKNFGLPNQYVTALAVKESNLFAATFTDGGSINNIYMSSDNGLNWTEMDNGLPNQNVHTLAVNGDNIFAGTYRGGVYLSKDNGASWAAASDGLPNQGILSLVVSGNNIYAGTPTGVFLSTNNGTTWTNFGLNQYINSLFISGSNIFAGTDNGVFISPLY